MALEAAFIKAVRPKVQSVACGIGEHPDVYGGHIVETYYFVPLSTIAESHNAATLNGGDEVSDHLQR